MKLRSLLIALCIAPATVAATQVKQPVPTSLPEVTLDCYQSYVTITGLPESAFTESAIDGDNFDTPTPRYRLQVVDKTTLKIIRDPTLLARRTETSKGVWEMVRDFTGKHRIVGWRELSSTEAKLSTVNFDDDLFSILQIPFAKVSVGGVQLHVFKCNVAGGQPRSK